MGEVSHVVLWSLSWVTLGVGLSVFYRMLVVVVSRSFASVLV